MLYLYLLTWTPANLQADHFDKAVVVATSDSEAARFHPCGNAWSRFDDDPFTIHDPKTGNTFREHIGCNPDKELTWAKFPRDVQVTRLGIAYGCSKPGVVCASYNQS